MLRELYDPSLGHLGLFGCNGRLIKRSIIIDNNVFFEEKANKNIPIPTTYKPKNR